MKQLSMKVFVILSLVLIFSLSATKAEALNPGIDGIVFNPAIDGGRYFSVYGSQTLPKYDFNIGVLFDYGREPIEYEYYLNNVLQGRMGVIEDIVVANTYASFGFVDWFSAGFNVPLIAINRFYNPALKAAATEQREYGLGDVRVEAKFRLLNIDRYGVGVAIIPFAQLPTGDSSRFHGYEQWNGGGKLVVDGKIADRFFISVNAGYQYFRQNVIWDADTPNAELDDMILLGGAAALKITEGWSIIGEGYAETLFKNFFQYQVQTPIEALVGTRYEPQIFAKGFALTVAAGKGMTAGVGASDFRGIAGISYHKSKVVTLPPPPPAADIDAQIEERIIITQKIHFAFNRSEIRPVSYPILNDVVDLLMRNPQIKKIRIEGHTDWIGSDAYNLKLSDRRANSVREYLIKHGVDDKRLVSVGRGESMPIADNNTDKGRAKNRRTEFTVTEADGAMPVATPQAEPVSGPEPTPAPAPETQE